MVAQHCAMAIVSSQQRCPWPPQEMTDWLRGKDIIGGLLRANLHLAQYVAQARPLTSLSEPRLQILTSARVLPFPTCKDSLCFDWAQS